MKGLGFFSLIVVLIAPVAVYAVPIIPGNTIFVGYGGLSVSASSPTQNSYYLDYDGLVSATISDIIFPTNEVDVFCVSRESLDKRHSDYDFYKFAAPSLSNETQQNYAIATWIADNWRTYITNITLNPNPTNEQWDQLKGEAQKAIWEVLDILHLVGSGGLDKLIYENAGTHANYVTENWLLAVNPSTHDNIPSCGYDSQDYLVPFALGGSVPAPEPSTLILLGLGLFGIGAYTKLRG